MSTDQDPCIGERVRRKNDGRIGHIEHITNEGATPRRLDHLSMAIGDVAIQLLNNHDYITAKPVCVVARGGGMGLWEEWERVPDNVVVTVCAECRQATCWYGLFFCAENRTANVIKVSRPQLLSERREHWSYLTDEGIQKYTGVPPERMERAPLLALMIRERLIMLGLDAREPSGEQPGNDGDFITVGPVDGANGPFLEVDTIEQCQSLTFEQAHKLVDALATIPNNGLREVKYHRAHELIRGCL